jgi:hypothetical protein
MTRKELRTFELLLGKLCVTTRAVEVVGSSTDGGKTTKSSKSASGHCDVCEVFL